MYITITCPDTRGLFFVGHKDRIHGNERADVLAKAALYQTKQFYYIPYTDFRYSISMYLDNILQGECNINVTSKVFEVQPIIKRSRFYSDRMQNAVT